MRSDVILKECGKLENDSWFLSCYILALWGMLTRCLYYSHYKWSEKSVGFKYQLISWIAVFFQQENLFVISELKDILPFYRNKCQELIAGHSTNRIWIDTNNIISKFYRTFWTLIASLIFVCCQYRWLDEWVGLCSLDGGTLHVSSFCVCMLGDLWCTRPTPSNGSRHCDVKQSLRGSTRLIGKKSDFCWELVSLTGTGRITWLLSLVLCCTSPEQGW